MISQELSQLSPGGAVAEQDLFYSAQFDPASFTYGPVSITARQLKTWASRPDSTTGAVLFQNTDGYIAGSSGLTWDEIDGLLIISNPLGLSSGSAGTPALTFGFSGPTIARQHGFYEIDSSTIGCIPVPANTSHQIALGVFSGVSYTQQDVLALDYAHADAVFQRVAPGVGRISDAFTGAGTFGFLQTAGQKRVTAQFDKTTDTTLADITGLSVNVAAGRTYQFQAVLFTTSNVGGGVQAAVNGTCTASAIIYEGETTNAAAISAQTRATALGTAVGAVTAVTVARIDICGLITVGNAGTLTIQFAQNVGVGTSSVLVGSYMLVQDMP